MTVCNYCHGQNNHKLGRCKFIANRKSEQDNEKLRTNVKIPSTPALPSSPAPLHSWLLYLLPLTSAGGQGMGVVVSSSCIISATLSSLHFTPPLMQGASHERQCFTNCSSFGPFHGMQSFRNRLLPRGLSVGYSFLQSTSTCSGVGSPRAAVWLYSHSSLSVVLVQQFLPFCKHVTTEKLPPSVIWPAVGPS